MNAVTVTFLFIGGIGVALLAVSLFVGDVLHFGHPDADGPFSVPSIAGFVGAFGFGGAIVAALTGGGPLSACGRSRRWRGRWPSRPLSARWPSPAPPDGCAPTPRPTRADLVGRMGVVVTPIPVQGYGEVRVSIGGQPVKLNARADRPVALGARVFVIEAPSDTSVVVEETTPV